MNYHCPACRKLIAREDRRRVEGARLKAMSGAILIQYEKEAPKLRCPCGKLIILLKGSLS